MLTIPLRRRALLRAALLTAVLAPVGPLASQSDDLAPGDPPAADGALRFDVPIHEEPGVDGEVQELWASRDAYKASFHDGVAFYPVLGVGYPRNLPVRWRTESIRSGARELVESQAGRGVAAGDWRYEIRHGAVVEAYDVREDGLEQTFVLADPSMVDDDLVIRGVIDTELRAAPFAVPAHAGIEFVDAAGVSIVRYGAATVVDAAGNALAIETHWDGARISLCVGAEWLATAAFPVVVDPLLSSRLVLNGLDTSHNPSLARSRSSYVLAMDSRAVSASDYDTLGVSVQNGFESPTLIFSLVSASLSTPQTRAAYVDHPDRWCIAMQIERSVFGVPIRSVGWHLRRPGDIVLRSVSNRMIAGAEHSDPVVGGDLGVLAPGDNALIVFQAGSGTSGAIRGAVIDCAQEVQVASPTLSEAGAVRCEAPDVIEQVRASIDPWVAVWQQEGPTGRRELRRTWIFNDGDTTDVHPAGHTNDLTLHDFAPKIDGQSGSYTIAFLSLPVGSTIPNEPTAPEIWVDSFRTNYIAGTTVSTRTVALRVLRRGYNLVPDDVSFDYETQSHWGVVSRSLIFSGSYLFDRLGFDGVALESALVAGGNLGSAVCYLPRVPGFAIAYSSAGMLRGRVATYPNVPTPTSYGAACGFASLSSELSHGNTPYAGHERFELRMEPMDWSVEGVLLIGVAPMDIPLPGGCHLLVDPLVALPYSATLGVTHRFRFAIPSSIAGRLHAQAHYLTRPHGEFGMTNGFTFDIVR